MSLSVSESILDSIGKTPLIRLKRSVQSLAPAILAKVESSNPGGSTKDRIALNMIEQAEKSGALQPGGTIIEATAGNTGLGLGSGGRRARLSVHLRSARQDERG